MDTKQGDGSKVEALIGLYRITSTGQLEKEKQVSIKYDEVYKENNENKNLFLS